MTLDEAIKHCEEVAEHNEYLHKRGYAGGCNSHDCLERAIIHRQLAEWLKELKLLRRKAKHLTEWNRKLKDYKNKIICKWGKSQEESQEAKRLLKLAIEDLNNIGSCKTCVKFEDTCEGCRTDYKWTHADEVLKLIGEEGE
jgi:hypothetical protein